jgi:hypothetical protein
MLLLSVVAGTVSAIAAREAPPANPTESQAVEAFQLRVKEYVALHEKLEATLPHLARKHTPEQLVAHQHALGDLIKEARKDSKPGEFFTPGIKVLVKRILGVVVAGPDGKTVKASIMDENPGLPSLVINERYPASIPLSTMPPQVLKPLPELHGELEYRFIGRRLILLDTEADIILDFTDDILPQ